MIADIERFLIENERLRAAAARGSGTMIECETGSIDYDESGRGPTVVLVPGSCSTGAAWRPVIAHWEDRFRSVTTSLLGYGGTAERRSADDVGIRHEAEIVESVIRWAGGPVHLVGHSFGGLTALAVALRNQVPLLSLSVLEAPALQILRHAGEDDHYRAFRAMTDAYSRALDAGKSEAIAEMIDFYGGAGTFAAWPQRIRDYAIATTPVNVVDWATAYGFELKPAALSALAVPTLLLWGEASHPAVKRANELIGQSLPRSSVATIPGAAHFMISTHPAEVARAIARHLGLTEYMRTDDVEGVSPSLT
jgi:pimeloyl-ACP methyl ester carboxylesterase